MSGGVLEGKITLVETVVRYIWRSGMRQAPWQASSRHVMAFSSGRYFAESNVTEKLCDDEHYYTTHETAFPPCGKIASVDATHPQFHGIHYSDHAT